VERTFIETARRAQIVAAAIDTIGEAGFAGASFARIAGNWGPAAA
jgi:AcrR family transcriptional regulator